MIPPTHQQKEIILSTRFEDANINCQCTWGQLCDCCVWKTASKRETAEWRHPWEPDRPSRTLYCAGFPKHFDLTPGPNLSASHIRSGSRY